MCIILTSKILDYLSPFFEDYRVVKIYNTFPMALQANHCSSSQERTTQNVLKQMLYPTLVYIYRCQNYSEGTCLSILSSHFAKNTDLVTSEAMCDSSQNYIGYTTGLILYFIRLFELLVNIVL